MREVVFDVKEYAMEFVFKAREYCNMGCIVCTYIMYYHYHCLDCLSVMHTYTIGTLFIGSPNTNTAEPMAQEGIKSKYVLFSWYMVSF